MRIIVDECVPRQIRSRLEGHYVRTAREAGFGGYKNGQLLNVAEQEFDILVTSDKNLRYQQNLTGRKLAILLLSTNNRTKLLQNGAKILSVVNRMKPGKFEELEI